jgi:hypothetical protein
MILDQGQVGIPGFLFAGAKPAIHRRFTLWPPAFLTRLQEPQKQGLTRAPLRDASEAIGPRLYKPLVRNSKSPNAVAAEADSARHHQSGSFQAIPPIAIS